MRSFVFLRIMELANHSNHRHWPGKLWGRKSIEPLTALSQIIRALEFHMIVFWKKKQNCAYEDKKFQMFPKGMFVSNHMFLIDDETA